MAGQPGLVLGEVTQCRTGADGVLWWRPHVQTRLMKIDDENDFIRHRTFSHKINSTNRDEFVLDKMCTLQNLMEIY